MEYIWLSLVLAATIIGSLGTINLKIASSRIKGMKTFLNRNLILGYLLYGAATVIYIPALKAGNVSLIYPMISLAYIWVSLLSVRILKERMTARRWAGIFLIMIGVFFIGGAL